MSRFKVALLTLIMKLIIKENENDRLNFKCLPTEKVYSQVGDFMKCSGILSGGIHRWCGAKPMSSQGNIREV